MVWVHNMKNITYFDNWTSNCHGSESQRAMEVHGGDQWVDVYTEMTLRDVIVVGGSSKSVGAGGGYVLGGGHGTLSP